MIAVTAGEIPLDTSVLFHYIPHAKDVMLRNNGVVATIALYALPDYDRYAAPLANQRQGCCGRVGAVVRDVAIVSWREGQP